MKFEFVEQTLKGVYIIELKLLEDERGAFARTYCKKDFEKIGHSREFVQMNHSWNLKKGTVRGLHYQVPPFSEIKLIRCVKGAVIDVVVDLRKDSPTFLQHLKIELSENNKRMIYIPEGFAHGFQTLSDNSELIYHHTEYYVPNAEGGLRFNDPELKIVWPLEVTMISERDMNHELINKSYKGI